MSGIFIRKAQRTLLCLPSTGFWSRLKYFQNANTPTIRAAGRIRRPRGKRDSWDHLREKRAKNFQDLEISFGQVMLVYFMRPPQTLKHWVLWCPMELVALGQFAPCPPLGGSAYNSVGSFTSDRVLECGAQAYYIYFFYDDHILAHTGWCYQQCWRPRPSWSLVRLWELRRIRYRITYTETGWFVECFACALRDRSLFMPQVGADEKLVGEIFQAALRLGMSFVCL